MPAEALRWLEARLRPRPGWLALALLLAVALILGTAVRDAAWIPEDGVVLPAALLGFLLAAVLGQRRAPAWLAWGLITAYGLLLAGATLGGLWPAPRLLFGDPAALRAFWLENGAFFAGRAADWGTAVFSGGRSNETIVFALLLALLVWFLGALLGWTGFRAGRPLPALLLIGLALALNAAFGGAALHWAALFVGLAALAAAVFHFAAREADWQARGVDYASQLRLDALGYGGGIALALLALAFTLPTFSVSAAARLLLDNEQAQALEATLDRAFGGVDAGRAPLPAPGAAGGAGVLPRAFLLGSGPELERFIMMTAVVETADPPGAAAAARHWRGLSYPVYTGQGWTLGAERERAFIPGELLAPPAAGAGLLRTAVHWRYDNRALRYSLGLPERLDQQGTAVYDASGGLVRVLGAGAVRYIVESRLPLPDGPALRGATLAAVPPEIAAEYTALPQTVPQRVHDLAAQVSAGAGTPYDQALALEAFLRQYPYDLAVPAPPPEVDVVDFFLFDLQRGYCDYYATAMAVLARSLGIPARLATGYAAAAPDETGQQTIRQNAAHSWPELYFAGSGWVAFEPTAAYPSPHAAGADGGGAALPPSAAAPPAPLPPQTAAARPWSWTRIFGGAALLGVAGYALWRLWRRPRLPRRGLPRAYGRLQLAAARLGLPLPASQTPAEFAAALRARLGRSGGRARGAAQEAQAPAAALAELYARGQYGPRGPATDEEARRLWARLRRPLWVLYLLSLGRGANGRAPRQEERNDER